MGGWIGGWGKPGQKDRSSLGEAVRGQGWRPGTFPWGRSAGKGMVRQGADGCPRRRPGPGLESGTGPSLGSPVAPRFLQPLHA